MASETYTVFYKPKGVIELLESGTGQRDDGILLERALHGSIAQFLENPTATGKQKLAWACQATKAVSATHEASVYHCDISVNNLHLDESLTIKLCDFQGQLLRLDGTVDRDGLSRENTKSCMPRTDDDYSYRKTDIFALGFALYYILQGHEPFPDLDPGDDEEEIKRRFMSGQFPELPSHLMNLVTHKC
ncbi:hypothetical protein HO173_007559 [Letharia columbiana]|uniref:Protein kinase domain-containing protein n=1 Tax=Letharia columbiana TaxID=112416 RepID=A0A8H6L3I7_9LECA|nr:uncharacterized protein HO173_007559 [Letharia columbiana]KAF6234139.1 hypothetical protein HO173_007559 [Letharia columbiana]